MWFWGGVTLVGVIVVYASQGLSTDPAVDADTALIYPHWLVPVGYFVSLIGAAGLVIAYIRRKRRG